uniref:Potassium channel tetramerisation-type BTB domain-containing protein n=1 Tax=Branchiostoma floridae TaxID=7739 RepID=C3Y7A2_BRAFL|eukprot:XP_002607720.1 hypothetical protein BRAFLDRAFT_82833 [Branchiostoma floridae]
MASEDAKETSPTSTSPECTETWDWVRLNVGGTMFETTRTTLARLNSQFLDRLLAEDSGFSPPADGVYRIDRDPEVFRVLLNFASQITSKVQSYVKLVTQNSMASVAASVVYVQEEESPGNFNNVCCNPCTDVPKRKIGTLHVLVHQGMFGNDRSGCWSDDDYSNSGESVGIGDEKRGLEPRCWPVWALAEMCGVVPILPPFAHQQSK